MHDPYNNAPIYLQIRSYIEQEMASNENRFRKLLGTYKKKGIETVCDTKMRNKNALKVYWYKGSIHNED